MFAISSTRLLREALGESNYALLIQHLSSRDLVTGKACETTWSMVHHGVELFCRLEPLPTRGFWRMVVVEASGRSPPSSGARTGSPRAIQHSLLPPPEPIDLTPKGELGDAARWLRSCREGASASIAFRFTENGLFAQASPTASELIFGRAMSEEELVVASLADPQIANAMRVDSAAILKHRTRISLDNLIMPSRRLVRVCGYRSAPDTIACFLREVLLDQDEQGGVDEDLLEEDADEHASREEQVVPYWWEGRIHAREHRLAEEGATTSGAVDDGGVASGNAVEGIADPGKAVLALVEVEEEAEEGSSSGATAEEAAAKERLSRKQIKAAKERSRKKAAKAEKRLADAAKRSGEEQLLASYAEEARAARERDSSSSASASASASSSASSLPSSSELLVAKLGSALAPTVAGALDATTRDAEMLEHILAALDSTPEYSGDAASERPLLSGVAAQERLRRRLHRDQHAAEMRLIKKGLTDLLEEFHTARAFFLTMEGPEPPGAAAGVDAAATDADAAEAADGDADSERRTELVAEKLTALASWQRKVLANPLVQTFHAKGLAVVAQPGRNGVGGGGVLGGGGAAVVGGAPGT